MQKSTLLVILVFVFFIIIVGGGLISYFMAQSEISNLVVNTSSCYIHQGKPRIDLNISWENPCEDRYHIIFNNEKIPIEAKNVEDNSYWSSVTLNVDECSIGTNKTAILCVCLESNNNYYESNITLFYPPGREYNYSLYLCSHAYGELFDREECFSSSNEVNPTENINIHGSYMNRRHVPYVELFVVFEPCVDCKIPKYIELDTSTLSTTECEIGAKIDLNNIGVYNQYIYPSEESYGGPVKFLKAKDIVDIPVGKYMRENITSFEITPNPAGCNLRINSLRVVY